MTPSRFCRNLFLVLCTMLLGMRVAGAHVHYCFDGLDQPVSVHYLAQDLDGHQTAGHSDYPDESVQSGQHSDVIVALSAEATVKKLVRKTDSQDNPGISAPALPRVDLRAVPAGTASPILSSAPSWRVVQPPARGPPRFDSLS